MALPPRVYYTLQEVTARWGCNIADVAGWAAAGEPLDRTESWVIRRPNQTVQRIPPCVTPPALASLDRPGGTPHGSIADLGVRLPYD